MRQTGFLAMLVIGSMTSLAHAQIPTPKPGPEHDVLKQMVGNWETTMKMEGMEFKGTCVYKMDLGELWVASTFESEMFGTKFVGKGYDTYNPTKKKYIGTWIDSMTPSVMVMEGDYDKSTKTLTMTGDGMSMEGKPTKMKGVTEMTDADNMQFKMFEGDNKEPAFTIHYKRKK